MKKTILIADDDEAVLTMLERFFESENYNVVIARNGVQALAEFFIKPYDLLLLDLTMPDCEGWDVFNAVSKLHPMMPIIIMTGLVGQHERAARVGADALLEKPLDPPVLLQTVRAVLSREKPARMARVASVSRVGADSSRRWTAQAT